MYFIIFKNPEDINAEGQHARQEVFPPLPFASSHLARLRLL